MKEQQYFVIFLYIVSEHKFSHSNTVSFVKIKIKIKIPLLVPQWGNLQGENKMFLTLKKYSAPKNSFCHQREAGHCHWHHHVVPSLLAQCGNSYMFLPHPAARCDALRGAESADQLA